MAPADASEVTALIEALRKGEPDTEALYHRLYDDLHRIAHAHRARWNGNDTLNTTALVHEAYVKMAEKSDYESRAHVLAVASRAMRQVLVTYAEARNAQKRGGGVANLPLEEGVVAADGLLTDRQADDVSALEAALQRLEAVDPRGARIVECRFFGGMTADETAEALGVSEATVSRGWRAARAWLYGELRGEFATLAGGLSD